MTGIPSLESFAVIEQVKRHLDSVCSSDTAGRGTDTDRAALSRQLLEESRLLYEMSFEYKARANALLPVGRLPREVLLFIFSIVADIQPPHLAVSRYDLVWAECSLSENEPAEEIDYDDKTLLPPTIGWISLSHVSRSWRALCLSSPTLWAKSVGCLPQAIPEFVKRAGATASIQVRIRSNTPPTPPSAIFGVVPTERIQMIDWTTSPVQEKTLIDAICPSNLSFVEVLSLKRAVPREEEEESHIYTRGTLTAPSLQMLSLAGLFVPFSAPHLTYLSLRFIDFSGIEFLRICSSCPLLRKLDTVDLVFTDSDALQTSSVHATLAHLESFVGEISLNLQGHNSLLQHMTMPPSVYLCLFANRMHGDDTEETDYGSLAVTVAKLIWRHKPCTVIRVEDACIDLISCEGEEEIRRAEIVANNYPFSMLPRILPDLELRPFFKDITVLHIHADNSPQDKTALRYLFNLLPNVSHLNIFQGHPPISQLQPENAPTRILFNSLWSNSAGATPLQHLAEICLEEDIDAAHIDLAQDILEALAERAKRTVARLKLLNLECFEYPGDNVPVVAALGRLVDEIRWKGRAE